MPSVGCRVCGMAQIACEVAYFCRRHAPPVRSPVAQWRALLLQTNLAPGSCLLFVFFSGLTFCGGARDNEFRTNVHFRVLVFFLKGLGFTLCYLLFQFALCARKVNCCPIQVLRMVRFAVCSFRCLADFFRQSESKLFSVV